MAANCETDSGFADHPAGDLEDVADVKGDFGLLNGDFTDRQGILKKHDLSVSVEGGGGSSSPHAGSPAHGSSCSANSNGSGSSHHVKFNVTQSDKETSPGSKPKTTHEERLRQVKEREAAQRRRKMEEIQEAQKQSQKYREQQQEMRRRKLEDMRLREDEHRNRVEERRRRMDEIEKNRREAILKKLQEKEALDQAKRANQSKYAFGSSTDRFFDPLDPSRRSQSTHGSRADSDGETNLSPQRRATSAWSLHRKDRPAMPVTRRVHQACLEPCTDYLNTFGSSSFGRVSRPRYRPRPHSVGARASRRSGVGTSTGGSVRSSARNTPSSAGGSERHTARSLERHSVDRRKPENAVGASPTGASPSQRAAMGTTTKPLPSNIRSAVDRLYTPRKSRPGPGGTVSSSGLGSGSESGSVASSTPPPHLPPTGLSFSASKAAKPRQSRTGRADLALKKRTQSADRQAPKGLSVASAGGGGDSPATTAGGSRNKAGPKESIMSQSLIITSSSGSKSERKPLNFTTSSPKRAKTSGGGTSSSNSKSAVDLRTKSLAAPAPSSMSSSSTSHSSSPAKSSSAASSTAAAAPTAAAGASSSSVPTTSSAAERHGESDGDVAAAAKKTEEEEYKKKLQEARRQAKEEMERKAKEEAERRAIEEEQLRVELEAKRAEEARIAEQKRLAIEAALEEERLENEAEEEAKRQEREKIRREEEEARRAEEERIEKIKKEEAEAKSQKEEEERMQRKKRLESIMKRVKSDSPEHSSRTASPTRPPTSTTTTTIPEGRPASPDKSSSSSSTSPTQVATAGAPSAAEGSAEAEAAAVAATAGDEMVLSIGPDDTQALMTSSTTNLAEQGSRSQSGSESDLSKLPSTASGQTGGGGGAAASMKFKSPLLQQVLGKREATKGLLAKYSTTAPAETALAESATLERAAGASPSDTATAEDTSNHDTDASRANDLETPVEAAKADDDVNQKSEIVDTSNDINGAINESHAAQDEGVSPAEIVALPAADALTHNTDASLSDGQAAQEDKPVEPIEHLNEPINESEALNVDSINTTSDTKPALNDVASDATAPVSDTSNELNAALDDIANVLDNAPHSAADSSTVSNELVDSSKPLEIGEIAADSGGVSPEDADMLSPNSDDKDATLDVDDILIEQLNKVGPVDPMTQSVYLEQNEEMSPDQSDAGLTDNKEDVLNADNANTALPATGTDGDVMSLVNGHKEESSSDLQQSETEKDLSSSSLTAPVDGVEKPEDVINSNLDAEVTGKLPNSTDVADNYKNLIGLSNSLSPDGFESVVSVARQPALASPSQTDPLVAYDHNDGETAL